mgnify:FL=1
MVLNAQYQVQHAQYRQSFRPPIDKLLFPKKGV